MIVINTDDNIRERLVALTRDLILIPSIPSHVEDRRRCYEFIKNHLEYLECIELREFEKDRIPSLVAAAPGCHEPEILMCGHLDVITHPDINAYRSTIQDGRIYGPGAGDMKGAVAVLLEVFRSIHSQFPQASLGLAITADEETGGEAGIGYLVNEVGLRCASAMIPDGGSLNHVTVAEKGILHVRVTTKGVSAHAARPWLGVNPIENLMKRLEVLKDYFTKTYVDENHWCPTCTVTIIDTENETFNRIAASAGAVLDIRFPHPYTVEEMFKIVHEHCGPEVNVMVLISAEPTDLSPDQMYQDITAQVTGQSVQLTCDDGGSDARFLAVQGIPVVMSRPLVGNLHAQNEWIDIESMVVFYHIYEQYIIQRLSLV